MIGFWIRIPSLTAEDLAEYFKVTLFANGGDMSGDVDALTEPGSVTLRSSDGAYPSSGQLITKATACSLSGTGRVAATSEYTAGVTAIEQVETSTSDDLEECLPADYRHQRRTAISEPPVYPLPCDACH